MQNSGPLGRARAFAAPCLVVFLLTVHGAALGATASIFTISPSGAQKIDKTTDHFSVSLENSWISRQSGFLQNLLSRAKGGILQINGTVTFDDGVTSEISNAITLDDPKNSMGRSLGFRGPIYSDLPADIDTLELDVRVALTEEDKIASLLQSMDNDKNALPAEVLSAPWVGYAKLTSIITQSLFGTSDADYPLSARYVVSMPEREHYLVLVTSTDDDDRTLARASAANFSYQDDRLLFKGNDLPKEWSYFVFKIAKNENKRSVRRRSLSLETPWATVIRTQLRVLPLQNVSNVSELSTIASTTLTAITNLEKFLIQDRSFSNFDRATGLHYYAEHSVEVISEACKSKNLSPCPVQDLVQYEDAIADDFNLSKGQVALGAKALQLEAALEASGRGPASTDTPSKTEVAPLGILEKYLASKPELSKPEKAALSADDIAAIHAAIVKDPPVGLAIERFRVLNPEKMQ